MTATWRFTNWALGDHYAISLSDAVFDLEGLHLDGEWANPSYLIQTNSSISVFPSGDGTAGGDFNFVATLLPGDANLDGIVGSSDLTILSGNYNVVTSGGLFADADFNGDGAVSLSDLSTLAGNWSVDLTSPIEVLADLDGDFDVDEDDQGDTNGDGYVDTEDYDLFFAQLGLDLEVAV